MNNKSIYELQNEDEILNVWLDKESCMVYQNNGEW